MNFDGRRGWLLVGATVALFSLPPLLLAAVAGLDLALPPEVVVAALGLPLAVITLGLAYLARRVASEADEPTLIGDEMAEKVGMTSEEYRELTEDQ
jgi:hypothetical protein